MNREHFLHFRNAYLNFSSTTSNAKFDFTTMFGKISNFGTRYSKWIKVFSTGVIIYSSYYYLKRCKPANYCVPFFSYFNRLKKLLSTHVKIENKKNNIALGVKELSEHVKYDNGWFDELDELKKSLFPQLSPSSLLSPPLPSFSLGVSLRETTPRGEIVMYYDAETKSFNYYSNSKNIPYSTLDAVARKYVCLYNVPSIYIDIRDEVQKGREKVSKKENALKIERDKRDKNKSTNSSSSEKKSLFAAFKNYKTGRNAPAPKSFHNYNGNVKIEEFVVLKNNINKFIYKGTLEQCDADLKSHSNEDEDEHNKNKKHENDNGDGHGHGDGHGDDSCDKDAAAHTTTTDYFKLNYEKQDLSYADFKKKYNYS